MKTNTIKIVFRALGLLLLSFSGLAQLKTAKEIQPLFASLSIKRSEEKQKANLSGGLREEMNLLAKKTILKLSDQVNSRYPEMGPIVSPDGKTLYFSRYADPKNMGGRVDEEDIWYSEWDEHTNAWGAAKNIGAPLNNEYPNFINSISADGNTLLLSNNYYKSGEMGNGLSITHRTADGWSFPKNISIENSKKRMNWLGSYLSVKQNILIMSHEYRKDSYGENDLYVSFLKEGNTWTKPVNLGSAINTSGIETCPFLDADDSTLYFVSNSSQGYGRADIFMTKRLDDTWQNWMTPINLGSTINTERSESSFSFSGYDHKLYFSSENADPGNYDLYSVDMPRNYDLYSVDLSLDEIQSLLKGKRVDDNITSTSPVLQTGNSDTVVFIEFPDKKTSNSEYMTGINLIKTNNVFFDLNKCEIRKEDFGKLDRLIETLLQFPLMQIEVSGHTCSIGTSDYNNVLSYKRAKTVASYLVKKGVNKNRLLVKNYSKIEPMASNDNKDGRSMNRRVSFKVVSDLLVENH